MHITKAFKAEIRRRSKLLYILLYHNKLIKTSPVKKRSWWWSPIFHETSTSDNAPKIEPIIDQMLRATLTLETAVLQ